MLGGLDTLDNRVMVGLVNTISLIMCRVSSYCTKETIAIENCTPHKLKQCGSARLLVFMSLRYIVHQHILNSGKVLNVLKDTISI